MRTLVLFGFIASILLGGCATYQMGNPVTLPYSSIYVAPPQNYSNLPQLEGPLNAALRQAIQSSGDLSLASGNTADATLEISILEIRRNIAAVSASDVGRGRKFEILVELEISLRKGDGSGQYFFESRPLSITQDVYTESGLVDAEYHAVPEISRQIADRVAQSLVDLW
ncbi:LPS assembly lipoprotein LptE [Pelagicoccus sp. SDUM812002]|uniref:LPS assembly lipoprotein LptE n=1 Tax=Pelagicoccus sp. SDUM812002 TaxID=3041266 RepID=UPI00280FD877|nr:LPS assembly lipoprotein LptE [Pelagicoccus sp. SDUM812002]MDQ8185635.1 LPS assembly lipoprotein LptE [Pelagicoccus sp. SDUM812002]